jgi:hypothetical protein
LLPSDKACSKAGIITVHARPIGKTYQRENEVTLHSKVAKLTQNRLKIDQAREERLLSLSMPKQTVEEFARISQLLDLDPKPV